MFFILTKLLVNIMTNFLVRQIFMKIFFNELEKWIVLKQKMHPGGAF
jgi:hypothetical protein